MQMWTCRKEYRHFLPLLQQAVPIAAWPRDSGPRPHAHAPFHLGIAACATNRAVHLRGGSSARLQEARCTICAGAMELVRFLDHNAAHATAAVAQVGDAQCFFCMASHLCSDCSCHMAVVQG